MCTLKNACSLVARVLIVGTGLIVGMALTVGIGAPVAAQTPVNTVVMEVFVRGDSDRSSRAAEFARVFAARTPGLEVAVHDVLKDQRQLSRLWKLARDAGREKPVVPMFYSCNRLYFGFAGPEKSGPAIEDLLSVHVYTRDTCPKCRAAKSFISRLKPQWPAIRFRIYEITYDLEARRRYEELCRSRGRTPGLPTIHFASHVLIGYQGDHVTGAEIEGLIRRVANRSETSSDAPSREDQSLHRSSTPSRFFTMGPFRMPLAIAVLTPLNPGQDTTDPPLRLVSQTQTDEQSMVRDRDLETRPPPDPEMSAGDERTQTTEDKESNSDFTPNTSMEDQTDELPFDDVPLPEEAGGLDYGESELIVEDATVDPKSDTIELPLIGPISMGEMGLPLFTFLVGLIDGFNPCAMWILVFLLSVLVNIKDRWKILLIAGTFVVVSGLAYYAFMVAWLNAFMYLLIDVARPAQVILGTLAIVIGVVNVKDFFAFKKGISFSIPESAKPGLYRRVRQIVSATYVPAALGGVVVLAVVVNVVELLCTAGLPALYTNILTMQDLPAWKNYAYLALYISAYMLDDTILLAIVVATLSNRRLQEREGRWLKLISGVVILGMGLVMLFRPELLQLGH